MSDSRPPGNSPPRPRPGVASGQKKVITAARAQPIEDEKVPLKERLASGASNAALNAFSVAKETVSDFKASDRFFKIKAAIVAGWVVLSAASLAIACPGNSLFANNDLHARLVIAANPDGPILMLENDGRRAWKDVIVIVNHDYRAAAPNVAPQGDITITPRQLMGPNNKLAPKDLHATDVELRTAHGHAVLMADGELK